MLRFKLFSTCFFICALMGTLFFFLGFLLLPNEQFSPNLHPSFVTIFTTNFKIHFTTIVFSIISLSLYSLVFLFEQFFTLGFAFYSLVKRTSLRVAFSFFAGHGVVEVMNMFFTAAIGLFVTVNIIKMIKNKKFSKISFFELGKTFLILLIIDFVLLLIAALLETYLSPLLVDKSYVGQLSH